MKKRFILIVCVFLVLVFIIKIRETIILYKIFLSINEFRKENNRYYSVSTRYENHINSIEKCYLKDNFEKIILNNNSAGEYCEIKNLLTKEEIAYNVSQKMKYENQKGLNFQDNLLNIPNIINIDKTNNKSTKMKKILKIHYIIPTTYEGKKCYKIVTSSEMVIIDKSTYLPVFSTLKTANSKSKDDKIEYKYEFEVGTVTDDDIAVPNISDYKIE